MSRIFLKRTIFFIFCCLLGACAFSKKEDNPDIAYGSKDFADAIVSAVKPRWFKTVKRFQLTDSRNEVAPHRFFDIQPFNNIKNKTLNAVITTVEDSLYSYDLDIRSGQIYMKNKFCAQEDEYKRFGSEIFKPPFSIGVIPRILDQLNMPQKVIVFGGKEYFQKYHLTHYFDIRIVGGYIEQICPYGGCLDSNEWNSRLVLVGVQNGAKDYTKIKDLNDLKKMHNWDYIKAFIENGMGKNIIADNYYPAYRMGAEVSSGQSLSFLERNSTVFTVEKLKQMRLSCYKLYDYLWKDLSFITSIEKVATNKSEIKKKAIAIKRNREGRGEKPFHKRFIKNYKKFNSQYKTCSEYIYPSSINENPKRHWFFAYLTAFHTLHDMGYAYNCRGNTWIVNPVLENQKRAISLQEEFGNCSGIDIDRAMSSAVQYLDNLRSKNRKSFRYVDYDNGLNGTHHKLYSWIKEDGKSNSCSDKSDSSYSSRFKTFPKDIKWENRDFSGKTKSKMGDIIY